MSYIRKLIELRKNPNVRSIGIYTFTNFFAKGASFLLLFIFTNPVYILPSENGLLSLFSNSLVFLMPFLSLGIVHATSTDFFKLPKQEFRSFFTTGFIMPVIIAIFSTIILFIFRDYLKEKFGFPYLFIWVIPLATFLSFCNEQLLNLVRNNNEPTTYLKLQVLKSILELGISFVLVVYFAWRWQGRITGILVSFIFAGVFGFYYFIRKGYLFGTIRKSDIVENLIYAVPIILLQASVFSMSSLDKFFLSSFVDDNNETVGIYSIACTFSAVIILLCTALLQYLFPKIYSLLAMPEVDYSSIKKHFYYYAAATLGCALLLIAFAPFFYDHFINIRYHPALKYIFIICGGYFLWTISYFFYSFLLYDKRKKKITALSLCCIAVSIGCHYFFIKNWQVQGAAIAVFTCYFIVLIITLLFTREYWQHFLFLRKPGN